MKTSEIEKLLIEASTTKDWKRLNHIHVLLHDATYAGSHPDTEIDSREYGIGVLLDSLFVELCEKSPHLLPAMLPAFVIMCGDRDNETILGHWTATPPAPEPTRGFVQRNGNAGWSWYPKASSEECIRCGRWYEKGHCNEQNLCYSCQNKIAEEADTAAGGGS